MRFTQPFALYLWLVLNGCAACVGPSAWLASSIGFCCQTCVYAITMYSGAAMWLTAAVAVAAATTTTAGEHLSWSECKWKAPVWTHMVRLMWIVLRIHVLVSTYARMCVRVWFLCVLRCFLLLLQSPDGWLYIFFFMISCTYIVLFTVCRSRVRWP